MKLCGIICEFNPFTNGHEYLIQKAKAQTGLDIVCLMSGNFVQRGEMAILDKYKRAECAINAGASFVIEMPLVYSLSSAEKFAEGSIKCLMNMKSVTHLVFGVETDNILGLEKLARFKVQESKSFKEKISQSIKNGDSYSVAMYKAYKNEFASNPELIEEIFTKANNILALEYLTAIYKLKAKITPVYVRRMDNGYNSLKPRKVTMNSKIYNFASATYIRNQISLGKYLSVKKYVPKYSFDILKSITKQEMQARKTRLDTLSLYTLREKSDILEDIYDYNQSLANLVSKTANASKNLDEVIDVVTSKCFRRRRVNKVVLLPLLSLTKEKTKSVMSSIVPLNVLAVKSNKRKELSEIKALSKAPIIISNKDQETLLEEDKLSLKLNQESSNIRAIVCETPKTNDKTIFID